MSTSPEPDTDIRPDIMKFECHRYASFSDYYHTAQDPFAFVILASRDGFYFDKETHSVVCFSCRTLCPAHHESCDRDGRNVPFQKFFTERLECDLEEIVQSPNFRLRADVILPSGLTLPATK